MLHKLGAYYYMYGPGKSFLHKDPMKWKYLETEESTINAFIDLFFDSNIFSLLKREEYGKMNTFYMVTSFLDRYAQFLEEAKYTTKINGVKITTLMDALKTNQFDLYLTNVANTILDAFQLHPISGGGYSMCNTYIHDSVFFDDKNVFVSILNELLDGNKDAMEEFVYFVFPGSITQVATNYVDIYKDPRYANMVDSCVKEVVKR